MNNPDDMPVDVAEMRDWLRDHRLVRGLSWMMLGKESGIPEGTLSGWSSQSYKGDSQAVARRVWRYRQLVDSQAARKGEETKAGRNAEPDFVETPTAIRLRTLMIMAQRGTMTVAATGPGCGKTKVMRNYAACVANVWTLTIDPSLRGLRAFSAEVARAVTGKPASGWTSQLSQCVKDSVANRGGLIIVDEANHLAYESLEMLRAWHDATGVGVCLLGNEELVATIKNGSKAHSRTAFARLNRRIEYTHVQDMPLRDDVEVYLDAWGVTAADQRKLLIGIGTTPGSGALGEVKQIISHAKMLSFEDGVTMSLSHLRDAQAMRATSHVRARS